MLWRQQGEKCIYTGNSIGFKQLFGGEINIDHILPYSRTLDDSQGNKVVCRREANDQKGDRTTHEWLAAADPARYEEICLRAKSLPSYRKRLKFTQKELELNDFIERQLRDTAYISKLTAEYLKMLFDKDHDVLGLKGQYTAELRHQWGLETVLSDLHDSPAWHEQAELRPGEKNRADHRHHAIDAIIIATTTRSRLQQLSRIRKGSADGQSVPPPWADFRQSVLDRVKPLYVSHRVRRKVAGKLHEETHYGPVRDGRGKATTGQYVVRKPIETLTPGEIELIRDKAIRDIVAQAAAQAGLQIGRRKKGVDQDAGAAGNFKAAVANLKMPSGVPIKRVRIIKKDETIQEIRRGQAEAAGDPTQITYVKPGSMHHLCLFQWKERTRRRRDAVFITRLEAARRLRDGEPIIQRKHPENPDANVLMSLSAGEMVQAQIGDQQKLLVFRTAASTQGQLYFAEHSDSRRSAVYKKYVFNCNTLNARKVTVDPLGRIRWAND